MLYKQLVWLMLDEQYSNKEIYKKIGCSQAVVSRAKKEWESMCESQKRKILKEIKEIMGSDVQDYKNPNKKTVPKEKAPETNQAGFRTPYSAMRHGKSVITRY